MVPQDFASKVTVTLIGTATAIINIDGVNFLTDPAFDPANIEYDTGILVLKKSDDVALKLEDLPPIDAILLSHEDHYDNLDTLGRTLLNGRHILTTMDGAKNLAPRPGVRGLQPWESVPLELAGKSFKITATPCQHFPGGECIGFVIESPSFGTSESGLPNVVFFSGDTVYTTELSEGLRQRFHVKLAIMNLGAAIVPVPGKEPMLITMDGKEGAQLVREIGAELMAPMHFDSWGHFTEHGDALRRVLAADPEIDARVRWLSPGVPQHLL
uniref:Metallo-beta-lactamase domain-containing protein n=1 Tax=Globisporangium ultimum (strain ATCC 200006 / CBS 805.95 / DAOM BR144) TaxID=431595 RepID=K3WVU2_GLOUD